MPFGAEATNESGSLRDRRLPVRNGDMYWRSVVRPTHRPFLSGSVMAEHRRTAAVQERGLEYCMPGQWARGDGVDAVKNSLPAPDLDSLFHSGARKSDGVKLGVTDQSVLSIDDCLQFIDFCM